MHRGPQTPPPRDTPSPNLQNDSVNDIPKSFHSHEETLKRMLNVDSKGVLRRPPARHSSSDSSSPDRYRQRINHSHRISSKSSLSRSRTSASSPTLPPVKRRSPVKFPYFNDPKREEERSRRKYGRRSPSTSHSPTIPRMKVSHSSTSHRSIPRSGRTPTYTTHRSRMDDTDRHYHTSYSPHRRHPSESESRSRTRSRERERRGSHTKHTHSVTSPPTQIITIPVPVADYPYAFPSWPPQHSWGAPYHMTPMMPTAHMPPIRPPYGMPPFNTGMFRPQQRYPIRNYAPRPTRGNFSNRNA